MPKILNIDTLAAAGPARQLVLNGQTHDIVEMTVENFVVSTRVAEKLVADKAGMADQIEASVEMIKRSVPTLDVSLLRGLKLEMLGKIGAFVRGDDVAEAEAPEGEGAAGNE